MIYHVVFSQFKIPANLAQLAVPKMHCLYANDVVQPSVQHCPCYMAWKTKVHTWCRHYHLCINAPMWRGKRWLQGIIDPPSYISVVDIPTEILLTMLLFIDCSKKAPIRINIRTHTKEKPYLMNSYFFQNRWGKKVNKVSKIRVCMWVSYVLKEFF